MQAYNTFSPLRSQDIGDGCKGASVASGTANLWNTIMAGGITLVQAAFAAHSSGLVLFPIIVLVSGVMTMYTCDLLVLGSLRTNTTGYASFIKKGLGPAWGYVADFCVFTYELGACVTLAEATVAAIHPFFIVQLEVGALFAVVVSLVMSLSLPNLDSLASFSQAAFLLSLVFLCYMAVESSVALSSNVHAATVHVHAATVPWWPSSAMGVCNGISMMCTSWLCHYNVVPLFDEMREPKRQGWKFVMPLALTACTLCFLTAGILSVLMYPTSTQTVLEQFAVSTFGKFLSVCFGVAFVISMPLYQYVGSRSLISLSGMFGLVSKSDETDSESLTEAGATQPASQDSLLKVAHCAWAALTLLCVVLVKQLDNVVTITGAVLAVPIMLILPPLAWASLDTNEGQEEQQSFITSASFARLVTVFGALLWILCMYSLTSLK